LLENLADGSTLEFLFNPSTVNEAVEANYDDKAPVGLSHTRSQYTGTSNVELDLELYISDDGILRYGGDDTRSLQEMRSWLLSLAYPVSNQDFGRVGTPRVLFLWPNVWSVNGRVRRVKIAHTQFDGLTGRTTKITARLQFVVELDSRRLMADVQNDGMMVVEE